MSKEFNELIFDEIPGRFQAAMKYLKYCRSITDPRQCWNPLAQGRALSDRERAAYDTALDLIRLYLSGEVDMSGPPMTARAEVEPAVAPEPQVRIDGPGLPDPVIESD